MIIKSNFRDYYDSVMRYDEDRSLVYIREKKEKIIEREKYPFPWLGKYGWGDNITMRSAVIGFCGKLYPVFTLYYSSLTGKSKEKICHTVEDAREFIETLDQKTKDRFLSEKPMPPWAKRISNIYGSGLFGIKYFIEETKKINVDKYFIENNCPIFVGRTPFNGDNYTITLNDSLREFDFFRVFPPYQAFQEISMFLGGLAVPQKPIPEIPDEIMVEVKGFHKKYSFRKPKKEKNDK